MIRIRTSLDHKSIRRLVCLVLTLFVLLGYSLQSASGSTYYSMVTQNYATVSTPPVILQNGTAGTSSIYTNNTSAKVSVEAPLFDYVDNNDVDVDSSADRGMHSNFPAEQAGPDSIHDTLLEENTEAIEDYVDNNLSDVDNSSDVGSQSNFENEKLKDGIYDTLTESAEDIVRDAVTQGQDTSATVTSSHTLSYPSGNNRLVVVAAGFEDSVGDINITSATYDGQNMTKIVQATTGGPGYTASVAIFYLLDSSLPANSGSYSVEVTAASDPSADLWACVVSYTGVKQEAPDDYDSDNYVGSITLTSNLDCDEDGSMLVQACVVGNTGSFSNSSGTTEVIEDSDISSASAVFNEKLGQDLGARDLSCTHSSMNRGAWVGACWAPANEDYDLDIEVQFTNVIDFLPTEKLCFCTGMLGSEDLRVDYWNGTGWQDLATDLNAYSCNEYSISLTSTTFTIRFRDGTTVGDTTQDQWQIDASLLRVEGAGDKEDTLNQQSDVDSSADVGTHSDFNAMKTKDGYDNLTESIGEQQYTFFEDWESGSIASENWTTYSSAAQGRIVVDTVTPYEGSYALWMDVSTGGTYSLNELITNFDFSGATQVVLDFYHNEQGDENTAGSDHADHQNADGVYYTLDGSYWYHLVSLIDPSGWTNVNINVTADPDFQGPVNSSFAIKFTQYDNYPRTNDGRGFENINITYTTAGTDYTMDLEVQWIDLPYLIPNGNLSIYGGTMGDEDINVDVWNGTGWETVFTDLSSGWNNASITDWLTTSNFTIRFKGGNETGDSSQDTWQIDVALIHIWHDGEESYELDLEVQWTNADYDETNEELAIYVDKGNTHSLDAAGGYMIIGDGTPDWGSITGTISFWIKWDTVANRPWGQHDNMETRFSGGTNLILDWGAVGSITSSTSFTAGKWYFIAIVWDENTDDLYLYVGDKDNAPALDTYNNNWATPVSTVGATQNNFMASKNGVEPMDGHGDDLRYWNIDRTLTEIQSDYKTELTGSETNLRSYFNLNNNFDDIGPNNNDGSGSGSYSFSTDVPFPENIQVDVWNGTSWQNLFTDLTNGWNNISVSSHLDSSTFTIRFKGGNETGDTNQDSWNIDATVLHVWTSEGTYDYVLRVNNTVTDSLDIRLKKYADSNVNRLQNCTIYFHNSTDGTSNQIIIENGSYINQSGPWYDLGSSETIYIAMTIQANSAATSYVYAYLEIRTPNTTTYAQYVIAFEIT